MTIERHYGSEEPQLISYQKRLGLREYTICFDVQEVENGENEMQLTWVSAVLPLGRPTYGDLVAAIIRGRYTDDAMQAIINNYLLDDDDEEHLKEWSDMQAWRKSAKELAQTILAELDSEEQPQTGE